MPNVGAQTGFAIRREEMLVMTGAAPVSNGSPDSDLNLSSQSRRLLELVYHDDPLFRSAATQARAAMQGIFGLDRTLLEGTIFPGLDMGGCRRLSCNR